jgi:hypothetical protein
MFQLIGIITIFSVFIDFKKIDTEKHLLKHMMKITEKVRSFKVDHQYILKQFLQVFYGSFEITET